MAARTLGTWTAALAVAASMVGTGVFTTTGLVKREAPMIRRGPDIARCAIEQDWQIDRRSLAA